MTSRLLARRIAKTAYEHKGLDIVVMDFRKAVSFTDFFVIVSGTSDRHIQAVSGAVEEDLSKKKIEPVSKEGYKLGRWIVLDYSDVVVHIFHPTEREHYRLEELWHDVPRVNIKGITE